MSKERKQLLLSVEELRSKRNSLSKELGKAKQEGKDISGEQEKIRELKREIDKKAEDLENTEKQLNFLLLRLPNMIASDTPIGKDETDNLFKNLKLELLKF